MMKEALFWKRAAGKSVRCELCPRNCVIAPGKRGFCRARENRDGKLFSLVYGRPCSMAADPIEKKPLYHFRPGTMCLSIATVGCNLACRFCQNWEISQAREVIGEHVTPEQVVELALAKGLPGIAYTYTEPTVFFEYALDCMKLARKAGLYNVWVSNGYTSPAAARMAAKFMDAINVDLKGSPAFYKRLCAVPDPGPILEALKIYRKAGVHVELTTLVIPGENDSPAVIKKLSEWVVNNLGKGTPYHFSAYYPCHKMRTRATPVETVERCAAIARKAGLENVHMGNV